MMFYRYQFRYVFNWHYLQATGGRRVVTRALPSIAVGFLAMYLGALVLALMDNAWPDEFGWMTFGWHGVDEDGRSVTSLMFVDSVVSPWLSQTSAVALAIGLVYVVWTGVAWEIAQAVRRARKDAWALHREMDGGLGVLLVARLLYGNWHAERVSTEIVAGHLMSSCDDEATTTSALSLRTIVTILIAAPVQAAWLAMTSTTSPVVAAGQAAWRALLAGDGKGAIDLSAEAYRLDPHAVWVETNLAHGLLLCGRTDEALRIYARHVGRPVHSGARLWEHVIAADFAVLRKAGRGHPAMVDVERCLSSRKSNTTDKALA